MSERVVVVVGAGPGAGGQVARRFGREGYAAGLVSRSAHELERLAASLTSEGVETAWEAADVTDDAALRAAVTAFGERWGRIDVLHFNPSVFREKGPLELSPAELLADVHLGVGALLTAVQAARPWLSAGARITVTGSMAADRPWHRAASLGVPKAGVRNLVQSLDAALEPEGIRAVSVTVRGTLASEGPFAPERVAEAIWAAAHQDEGSWRTEVPYSG